MSFKVYLLDICTSCFENHLFSASTHFWIGLSLIINCFVSNLFFSGIQWSCLLVLFFCYKILFSASSVPFLLPSCKSWHSDNSFILSYTVDQTTHLALLQEKLRCFTLLNKLWRKIPWIITNTTLVNISSVSTTLIASLSVINYILYGSHCWTLHMY